MGFSEIKLAAIRYKSSALNTMPRYATKSDQA